MAFELSVDGAAPVFGIPAIPCWGCGEKFKCGLSGHGIMHVEALSFVLLRLQSIIPPDT